MYSYSYLLLPQAQIALEWCSLYSSTVKSIVSKAFERSKNTPIPYPPLSMASLIFFNKIKDLHDGGVLFPEALLGWAE